MSSTFHLPSSTSQSPASTPALSHTSPDHSDDDYDDDDEDTLPYPAELSRSDFVAPDFDAATYLSTLRNRHQTLEDLRADLRQRSRLLNQELLDLVNGNYEDFLSLGADLNGGEERVEGVRVGLLGFQREVEGIRKVVGERQAEVGDLLKQKKEMRREIVVGRTLLEIERKVGELEWRLGIKPRAEVGGGDGVEPDEIEDDYDEESASGDNLAAPVKRLQSYARQYVRLTRAIERLGPEHLFLVAQRSRIEEIQKTLLLDLDAALRQAKRGKDTDGTMAIVQMHDSVRLLKGAR